MKFLVILFRSQCGLLFALPWYLTWFGHSLNHYRSVVRLYDYFLASDPLMPLYLVNIETQFELCFHCNTF